MPVLRNRDGREIWFQRWLWSWVPCHWKGWLVILGLAAAANGCFWLVRWVSGDLDTPPQRWTVLVLLPFLLLGWWLAERHSPSRR